MTAGTADKVALYWYVEPFVLTHKSWCGDYTHMDACTRTTCTQHSHEHMHPRTHATLTHTHAHTQHSHAHTHTCMHTRVHHTTNTHSHAQVLNLHVHAHTSGPDRHIHNHVVPAHRLEYCRSCVNLCSCDHWDKKIKWRSLHAVIKDRHVAYTYSTSWCISQSISI